LTVHCEEVRDLIPTYAFGALTSAERAQVDEHVASCADCAADLRHTLEAVEQMGVQFNQEDPPPLLKQRVLARLRQEPAVASARTARVLTATRWWLAGASATALVLAAGLIGLLAINISLHSRISNLEQETDRLATMEARIQQDAQMLNSLASNQVELVSMVQQQRSMLYWLSLPGTQMAIVQPESSQARGYGMLVAPPDSSVAILVMAGLSPSRKAAVIRYGSPRKTSVSVAASSARTPPVGRKPLFAPPPASWTLTSWASP
jgi:anti-sigma factor RsiW